MTNTHQVTIEKQIAHLRHINNEESRRNQYWIRIPEDTIVRLAETAPAWPEGSDRFRSFRIRFGEGNGGVLRTFRAHHDRIWRIYGSSDDLRHIFRDEYPRLLNGDSTHKPIVEWVIADLATHRIRKSVAAVRGPMSLADELLVMRYMFPKVFQTASNVHKSCSPRFFAAGYEVRSLYQRQDWNSALVVSDYSPNILTAEPIDNYYTVYTVPTLLFPQPMPVA